MSKEMQSPAAPERQPKKSGSAGYMVILAACVVLFAVFGYFLRGNKLSPLVTGLAVVWSTLLDTLTTALFMSVSSSNSISSRL